MRRIAWALLLLFVFAIPWEYSLDLERALRQYRPHHRLDPVAGGCARSSCRREDSQARTDAMADIGSVSVVLLFISSGQLCRTRH